jgi:hypothetical protein
VEKGGFVVVLTVDRIQWSDLSICLAIGFSGLWFSFNQLWRNRNPFSTTPVPLRIQVASFVGSIGLLGGALVLVGSPLIHPKMSFLGAIGALLTFSGGFVFVTSFFTILMVSAGKIPNFLLPASKRNKKD